jgi:uncharacterized protein
MPLIPQQLNNYRVYMAGSARVGLATVTMPNIQLMTDTLKGSGIGGEIEPPVAGHVQAMTGTINFHTPCADFFPLFAQDKLQLEFYSGIQHQDTALGKLVIKQWKVVMRFMPTAMNLGTLEVGVKPANAIDISIEYIRGWFDGAEVFEIDPLNMVFRVNGIDYAADNRAAIGL